MGRRGSVTEAKLRRAIKVAWQADERSIVEVTAEGTIRILRASVRTSGSDVDKWFEDHDES